MSEPAQFEVLTDDGVSIAGEVVGEGPPIVLLHGLTATRRYVVMGSKLLQHSGFTVVSYDARGHGSSAPAPSGSERAGCEDGKHADRGRGGDGCPDYGYQRLSEDLRCVLDELAIERAVLVGASMGGHTSIRFALDHPHRVAALGIITPAFEPEADTAGDRKQALARWDALAAGLRSEGIDGFLAAYDITTAPSKWRSTVEQVIRQRLSGHRHLFAVADALEVVPRSRPFDAMAELSALRMPTVIIADRDEADPGHPLAVGQRYAQAISGARLLVEQEGASPLAWQGGKLSRALVELAAGAR